MWGLSRRLVFTGAWDLLDSVLAHLEIFGAGELPFDGVEDELLAVLHSEVEVFRTRLHLRLTIARVVGKGICPPVLLEDFIDQEDGACGDERIFILQHCVLKKDGLDEVAGEEVCLLLNLSDLGVSVQKLEAG